MEDQAIVARQTTHLAFVSKEHEYLAARFHDTSFIFIASIPNSKLSTPGAPITLKHETRELFRKLHRPRW
jgi:hypothetical protein